LWSLFGFSRSCSIPRRARSGLGLPARTHPQGKPKGQRDQNTDSDIIEGMHGIAANDCQNLTTLLAICVVSANKCLRQNFDRSAAVENDEVEIRRRNFSGAGMGWGLPDSPGHYLDFVSAVLGSMFLIAGILMSFSRQRA
jgi:hypothetical protein